MVSSSPALAYGLGLWLLLAPVACAADSAAVAAPQNPPASASIEKGSTQPDRKTIASDADVKSVHKEIKAEAVGELDGVPLDKNANKPKKKGFTIGDLNPFKWVFKPITNATDEVKKLGKDITEIETPITDLQEPMVGLREDMVHVSGQVGDIRTGISGLHHQMGTVDGHLGRMEKKLNQIYEPISELKDPVNSIQTPVNKLQGHIHGIMGDMKGITHVVTFTSTAIILAVVVIGLLVVVGTPIAAMVVWKHRSYIMAKLGGNTKDIDDLHHATNDMRSEAEVGSKSEAQVGS